MELLIIRDERSVELVIDVFKRSNSNTESINRSLLSNFQLLTQRMKVAWGSYCSVQELDGSTISVKASYGDLLSEFVETNCKSSFADLNTFIKLKIPESEKEYNESIDQLYRGLENFLLIHPFCLLSYVDFKKIISDYMLHCRSYIRCNELSKYSYKWIDDPYAIIFPQISFLKEESWDLIDELFDYLVNREENELLDNKINDKKNDLVRKMLSIMAKMRENNKDEIETIKEKFVYLIDDYTSIRDKYHKIVYYVYNLNKKSSLEHLNDVQRFEAWANDHDPGLLMKNIQYIHKIDKDAFGNAVLLEKYEVGLSEGCFMVMKELILSDTIINRCEHCKKSFKPKNRTDEKYCRRQVGDTVHKCNTLGPSRRSAKKKYQNKYQALFKTFRNRCNQRVLRKTMSKEDFEKWKKDATQKRDQAKRSEITYLKFKNWLNSEDEKLKSNRKKEKLSK